MIGILQHRSTILTGGLVTFVGEFSAHLKQFVSTHPYSTHPVLLLMPHPSLLRYNMLHRSQKIRTRDRRAAKNMTAKGELPSSHSTACNAERNVYAKRKKIANQHTSQNQWANQQSRQLTPPNQLLGGSTHDGFRIQLMLSHATVRVALLEPEKGLPPGRFSSSSEKLPGSV